MARSRTHHDYGYNEDNNYNKTGYDNKRGQGTFFLQVAPAIRTVCLPGHYGSTTAGAYLGSHIFNYLPLALIAVSTLIVKSANKGRLSHTFNCPQA